MLRSMADDDTLVVIASYLRPEEAGMLRGLLESAGIQALLRDDMLSSMNPFLQPIIGGVKLVVRVEEAERAVEIVRSAGVLPSDGPEEPVEIPEDEWSRGGAPDSVQDAGSRRPVRWPWPRYAISAALVLLALLLVRYALG
jgi:putative signal transducing protein